MLNLFVKCANGGSTLACAVLQQQCILLTIIPGLYFLFPLNVSTLCIIGIAGLIGAIDTVICGIVISVMSIPISLLETVLVAICLSAHHRWKILEDQIVKAQSRLKRNGSNRQQQSDNTNSHTHHNFMDNIVTDVEVLVYVIYT